MPTYLLADASPRIVLLSVIAAVGSLPWQQQQPVCADSLITAFNAGKVLRKN